MTQASPPRTATARVTLLTGGARSGKSRHALELAEAATPDPRAGQRAFVATAEAYDDEMRDRITAHQRERGPTWITVEAPLDLAGALRSLPDTVEVAVVDCLTVWLSNLLHRQGRRPPPDPAGGEWAADEPAPEVPRDAQDEAALEADIAALLQVLQAPPCALVLVTNEVGQGIVPMTPLGRRFRDRAGGLNQQVAHRADVVKLLVCGQPLVVKGAV
jgi:adenosylcobinamide kinase/adenosylcobinamide-phosphate guanylyltransferase